MKKRKIANIIMIAVILIIAAAGILTVGHIQGWFDQRNAETAVLTEIRGIITMERNGVAYNVENDTVLRNGDKVTCTSGATAIMQIGDSFLTLGEKANVTVVNASIPTFSAAVLNGEVFANTNHTVALTFDGKEIAFTNAVGLLSVRSGAQSIYVFAGTIADADSGKTVNWINGVQSVTELKINSLNDFTIAQVRSANASKTLCFSNADLDKLIADREAEMQAQLDSSSGTTATDPTQTDPPPEASTETTPENTRPTTPQQPTVSQQTEPPATDPTQTNPPATESPATEPPATQPPATEAPTQPKSTCTITIRCDTILNNMDNLDPAKVGYVPNSGVILSAKTVEFTEGETVFDILTRVCSAYGIQIEYSWTPMYNSYYIEGINNLYEFDCGSESGWMYKVNGWFPNYGCSSYTVSSGDNIVWCYTCNGLGADVGG